MPIVNGYCTLGELQDHVMANGGGSFSPEDDDNMEIAITAVSRWVDNYFDKTTFYAVTDERYFTPDSSGIVYVDDLLTVTELATDTDNDGTYSTVWTTDDYWLMPRNAQTPPARPYRSIKVTNWGAESFPTADESVRITGEWGYSTEENRPPEIKQFTLLMSHRLWKRKDAIFGIAGTPALGVQVVQAKISQDSDLIMLLGSIDKRLVYAI